MVKETKRFLFVVTSLLVGGMTAFAALNSDLNSFGFFNVKAADCSHTHVEHYAGYTQNGTGVGYVEHWACCVCHTAWADEGLTTVIGNTENNRDNINVEVGYSVGWGAYRMAPKYVDGAVTYTDSSFELAATAGDDPYYYIETETNKTISSSEFAKLTILNHSAINTLNVTVLDGTEWAPLMSETFVANKDENCEIVFNASQWGAKPRFILKDASGAGGTGTLEFKLEFTRQTFVGPNDDIVYGSCAVNSALNGWASFTKKGNDAEYGEYTVLEIADATSSGEFDVIVNGTGGLTEGQYATVKFAIYNPTSLNIGLKAFMSTSGWGSISNQDLGTLTPGWNVVYMNAKNLENASTHFISLRFNFTSGGNSNDWRISKFIATPAEYTKVNLSIGKTTATGDTDSKYGAIYTLERGAYYVENNITNSFGDVGTGALRSLLGPNKTSIEFKMYNPLDVDVTFHVDGGNPWGGASRTTLASKQWTVVRLSEIDFALNDTGTVYFYANNTDASGWLVTDAWATNLL